MFLLNLELNFSSSFVLFSIDKITRRKLLEVIANVPRVVELVMTHLADHVNTRLSLKFIIGIPRVLQKLHRYFTLRKKYLYSEFFWFAFSPIRSEYEENEEIQSISPYSVQIMQENLDQNNSEYVHF